MWRAEWLGHIMLSLTTHLGKKMVKNYQNNWLAQQVNYAHRRKTMNVLFSHYTAIFITALMRDSTLFLQHKQQTFVLNYAFMHFLLVTKL